MSKLIGVVTGALLLGLLIVGCGGGGSDGTQASLEQANAACKASTRKAAAEIKAAYKTGQASGALSSERSEIQLEVTKLVPILIGTAESQAKAIGSLEGDEAEVNQIEQAYRSWIQKAKATPLKIVVANDIYNQARERAEKYGLSQCDVDPFEIFSG